MTPRDHGGSIDAAIAEYGGTRENWIDLSTGINPVPFPIPDIPAHAWTTLPDRAAEAKLVEAARNFWNVPDGAEIVPASGASAIIAALPRILDGKSVDIAEPTYNEHRAAFDAAGWINGSDIAVRVHPNNPDGQIWSELPKGPVIVDESFCDVMPEQSHVAQTVDAAIVLKSFGKFWGLAGLRLGFAIARPEIAARLRLALGPWAVSGPALTIGTAALTDTHWATTARLRLATDRKRFDVLLNGAGLSVVGGTDLFRLTESRSAARIAKNLAQQHILVRTFPYAPHWIRFGLPSPADWPRVDAALTSLT